MEKIKHLGSANIVEDNIAKLKQLFPTVFSEGKVVMEELQALLGETVEKEQDYYEFNWAGKSLARQEANKMSTGTLRPCKKESKNWDDTQNLFIEGDNLEVLKLLQKSYSNKIKMIYIDPPYNTGKEFVYKDNYKDTLQEYLKLTEQVDEEGKKLLANTDSDGRYHSNWLNMMYPRLKLARNLLTEDGVIFISIDDNEQANLKKLCDEIFGGENFVADVIWEKKYAPQNDARWFSDNHDYILVYSKNKNNWFPNALPRTSEQNNRYTNRDNDPRGPWKSSDFSVKTYSANYDYPITTSSGRVVNPPISRCWRTSKENFKQLVEDNRIWFGENGDNVPSIKRFLSEVKDGVVPMTIWKYKEVGHNQDAAKEIRELFDGHGYFDTPKPTKLLRKISFLSTDKDSIILDFFAGSGTTAHAVMALNAEDGGHRKCISVQLPEPTDEKSEAYKAGYKTIAEIAKERIRRVGELVKKENKDKEGIERLDTGFRVFKLDSSNIKRWDTDPEQFEKQLELFGDVLKEGRSESDVLYEILLKYGLDLTIPIQEKQIADNKVYNIGFGSLYACLDQQINPDVAQGIGEWHKDFEAEDPNVIFRDSGFAKDADKTNAVQTLKQFGIENVKSI